MKKYLLLSAFICCFIHVVVAQIPTISSFAPASANVGATVTINGTNFSTTPANNIVYFGSVRATVGTPASSTSLTVTVPAGSAFMPLSVTVNGLTAYSAKPFITTFTGGGTALSTTSFGSQATITSGGNDSYSSAIGDLDNDGKPDVVTAIGGNNSNTIISVFQNTSTTKVIALGNRMDVTTGLGPTDVKLFDVDGDGKLDVVVSNGGVDMLSFLRNTSTGASISFATKFDYAIGSDGSSLIVADFDLDGKPDLAYSAAPDKVSVLRNTTVGTTISFTKTTYTVGSNVNKISCGDYDGDGKMDISAVNFGAPSAATSSLSILRNTSTGTGVISFAAKVDLVTEVGSREIATGDLDGDGKLDIVISDNNYQALKSISLFRNTGTPGTIQFDAKVTMDIGATATNLALNDMDGDGKADIFFNTSGISVLRNTSTAGSFSFDPKASFRLSSDGAPASVNSADFDLDGKVDLFTTSTSNIITVGKNQINGPGISICIPNPAGVDNEITLTGVNFTGATEVAFGGTPAASFTVSSATSIKVKLGTGSPGAVTVTTPLGTATISGFIYSNAPLIFSVSPAIAGAGTVVTVYGLKLATTTSVTIGGIAAASFKASSEGSMDVVLGQGTNGNAPIVVTNPDGNYTYNGFTYFSGPVISNFYPSSGAIGSIVTITGSGFNAAQASNVVRFGTTTAEVTTSTANILTVKVPAQSLYQPITVTANGLTAYSTAFFNVRQPSPQSTISTATFAAKTDLTQQESPEVFALGDFNADGKADVATVQDGSNTVSVFKNNSTIGNYVFDSKIDLTTGSIPIAITTGDFDSDGKLDIAVANSGSASVSVFINTSVGGPISFNTKVDFATNTNPQSIATGDLNGDGKPDLATANFTGSNYISVLINNTAIAGISFATKVDFTAGKFPTAIAIADLDNDLKPEVLVANGVDNTITIFNNIGGNGTLSLTSNASRVYPTGNFPNHIVVGFVSNSFVNNSIYPDVLVTNNSSSSVSYFKNQRSFLTGQTPFTVGNSPSTTAFGDINGDGWVDLVTTNTSNSTVSVIQTKSGSTFEQKFDLATGTSPVSVAIADLDGDRLPDIITSNSGTTSFSVLRNITPSIFSFTPASAMSGTEVTIEGTNLGNTTGVTFGGIAASSFTIVSPTAVKAGVGQGANGSVVLTSVSGTTSVSGFTYIVTPSLTSFVPISATTGTTVAISGQNLTDATGVSFGGTAAASFTVDSPVKISAVVGEGATGKVSVTFPFGMYDIVGFQFIDKITAVEPDVINSFVVFPNPSNGREINLQLPASLEGTHASIGISDLTGRSIEVTEVICEPLTLIPIKNGQLKHGLYIVTLMTDEGKFQCKMIVHK